MLTLFINSNIMFKILSLFPKFYQYVVISNKALQPEIVSYHQFFGRLTLSLLKALNVICDRVEDSFPPIFMLILDAAFTGR